MAILSKRNLLVTYLLITAIAVLPFISYSKIADATLLSRQLFIGCINLLLIVFWWIGGDKDVRTGYRNRFVIAMFVWLLSYAVGMLHGFSFAESAYTFS